MVILLGLARRTARKSIKHHYFTVAAVVKHAVLLGLQRVGRHVQLPNPVLIAVPAAPAPQRAVSQGSPREMETLEGATRWRLEKVWCRFVLK